MSIQYDVCPECGYENAEKMPACGRCDNRLFSHDDEAHRRYVALVTAEHRKRTLLWWFGWAVVAAVAGGPVLLVLTGRKLTMVPGASALVGAMVLGWRLVDLKAKRAGSAAFLTKYR